MISESMDVRTFKPSEDAKGYRSALGRFATGITVITTSSLEGPVAITANSFSSVSLEPALVLWCPDKSSSRHKLFVEAKSFAIHVLTSDQQSLCNAFVKSARAFGGVDYDLNAQNVPIIEGCLATFECQKFAAHDAGDHTILIGEVLRASHRPGEALVFANGMYRKLPID